MCQAHFKLKGSRFQQLLSHSVNYIIRGWVNNFLQCSCIYVSVGSTVVFASIASRGFLLITTVQVWSCSVSSFVPTLTLNMAAPLSVCTKEEQRSLIRFLWSEGISGAEIRRRLSAQYGNSVLPQRGVYQWIEIFKNVRTSVTHEGNGACVARCSAKNIFFSEGIKKLVQRWKKCTEKQGDYVEKWCYCKFYIFIEIKFVSVVRIITDSLTYIFYNIQT